MYMKRDVLFWRFGKVLPASARTYIGHLTVFILEDCDNFPAVIFAACNAGYIEVEILSSSSESESERPSMCVQCSI